MSKQTIPVSKDTYASGPHPDDPCGIYDSVYLARNRDVYLGFDISSASAAGISSVYLHLYQVNFGHDSAEDAYFERTIEDWEEATLTYNNAPATTETNRYKHTIPAKANAWRSFNVTNLYLDAVPDGELGIKIVDADPVRGSTYYRFYSKRRSSSYASYLVIEYEEAPTITALSWSPTGDYSTIATGAALVESVVGGGTTQLMLVATNPFGITDPPISEGEAILQIDMEDPFIVAPGDHFRFNNKEWWALNIICGPECDLITIADETAEAEKIPKIGDEITFAAAIDWHGQEMSTIKWYYAKAPGACFDDIWDLDWEEFAVGENTNMPAHTFEAEGDEEITFFMVTATNMDFATGEIDTLCGPIFNLWKYMPSWWDQLLEAIRTVNAEDIAHPIVMLSENVATMPGWTEPPFKCPICEQVFEAEDSEVDYAKHLVAHINAFVEVWFEEEE